LGLQNSRKKRKGTELSQKHTYVVTPGELSSMDSSSCGREKGQELREAVAAVALHAHAYACQRLIG
jgi:hypothetical protein